MAALLRQGARRIGGYLIHRTQAAATSPAVAEESRRLVPRRMYYTEEFITLLNDIQAYGGTSRETQRKIDEIYDLICKAEKDDRTSNMSNAWLLPHLSRRVTPTPSNSDWYEMYSTSEVIRAVKHAGILSLILLAREYYNAHYSNWKFWRGDLQEF